MQTLRTVLLVLAMLPAALLPSGVRLDLCLCALAGDCPLEASSSCCRAREGAPQGCCKQGPEKPVRSDRDQTAKTRPGGCNECSRIALEGQELPALATGEDLPEPLVTLALAYEKPCSLQEVVDLGGASLGRAPPDPWVIRAGLQSGSAPLRL